MERMEKEAGPAAPEYEGEWTDWWANGTACAPREVAASRAAKRFLAAAAEHRLGRLVEEHHALALVHGDDRVLEPGGALVGFQLALVRGHAGELQHVHARHLGVHFLKGAGLHQRMDAFPGADGKMVVALGTDFQVIVQFLVEHHGLALGALGPQAFRDLLARGALLALDARRKDLVDPAHSVLLTLPP